MAATKQLIGTTLALALILGTGAVWARGGGGFGGGRGGGFGGGRGDFGGFDRGFDNRAPEYYGGGNSAAGRADDFANRADDLSANHSDAFNSPMSHVSDSDLRANANKSYDFGNNRLPTDAGFGHYSPNAYAGARGETYRMPPQEMAMSANNVRSEYANTSVLNHDWWNHNPNAWRYPYWGRYDWPMATPVGPMMCGFWGMPIGTDLPEYDYGNNIYYDNNEVYYGSTPTATADEYYDQAQTLADSVPSTSTLVSEQQPLPAMETSESTTPAAGAEDWKPLGVFSLVQGQQRNSTSVFQLAVDKNGVIRGNYDNLLTNEVKPVQGKIDKKSMRAAWTVGSNKTVVYDTGLYNLTQPQGSILIHFNKGKTEQWNLVRLDEPKAKSAPAVKTS